MSDSIADEILERVWVSEENNKPPTIDFFKSEIPEEPEIERELSALCGNGLLMKKGDEYRFTPAGKEKATRIIRQHRLAEIMMSNVLGVGQEEMESAACAFEHAVMPEIVDGICTLLGHPTHCPHGSLIPPGECCDKGRHNVLSEAIIPLSDVKPGREVKIAYLNSSKERRMHHLSAMGVHPGALVRVHQTSPAFVIELGGTQVAMEGKVASDILVWKNEK